MRTNLRSRLGARATGYPIVPTPEVDWQEPKPVEPQQPTPQRAKVGPWSEDWSDPTKLRQMSPVWPLLWLAVPFALAVLYEFFNFR